MAQVVLLASFVLLATYYAFVVFGFFRHFDPVARKVFIILSVVEIILLIFKYVFLLRRERIAIPFIYCL